MPEQFELTVARRLVALERKVARLETLTRIGKIEPTVTLLVGPTRQFTTIQDAIDFASRNLAPDNINVVVDAGTYNEALHIDYGAPTLVLSGDTRLLAGKSYLSGNGGNVVAENNAAAANGGSGNCTLSNTGKTLTVAMSTTNPNFEADGWGSGDQIYVFSNASVWAYYTIASVSGNVFTLTETAPAVGNLATSITLLPNRRIYSDAAGYRNDNTVLSVLGRLALTGFWVDRHAASGSCAYVNLIDATLSATRCVFEGGANTLLMVRGSLWGSGCSVVAGVHWSGNGALLSATYSISTYFRNGHVLGPGSGSTAGNMVALTRSIAYADLFGTYLANGYNGLYVDYQSYGQISGGGLANFTGTGLSAYRNSYIQALSTKFMYSLATPYSPAVSVTEGNYDAMIEY